MEFELKVTVQEIKPVYFHVPGIRQLTQVPDVRQLSLDILCQMHFVSLPIWSKIFCRN